MGNKVDCIVNPKNPIIDSTNRQPSERKEQSETDEFQIAS
jgi:hypothetical protein